ncbi:hypothetical protein EI546_01940 [Aequorivita sp. H23M31]|uniref:Uncharacterized protein n=1 Tax=Aequorivita ciconiae TaxID=2494375 RepID=A0A410FZW9_9FLAO|nr:hypothetical protein [Aequorivita sp. H23M31]QAA80565.1 hypothetical protein EI546_01940 [Aequorivita sp. H23M31]
MEHLKLTFGDIAQRGILYYDKEVEKACHSICETLKIDNMPDYDSAHYFQLQNGQFQRKSINEENKLQSRDRIFEEELIKKFNANTHNVLFVFKGDVLSGIVHFSDYNQTKVLQAIQDDVLTFERKLRQYLFLKNFRNEDMLKYFEYRAGKNEHSKHYYEGRLHQLDKRKEELNQLGEFQMFDLKDLLEFGNDAPSKNAFQYEKVDLQGRDIYESTMVNSLRNMAMHGKNPIEMDEESSVYSIESLEYLFHALKILETFTYRIEKLIADHEDYKKSVIMDNRSKLEIIYQHHPKAINYFMGN